MRTKNPKPNKASNASSFLTGRMSLIICMLSVVLTSSLTSCQNGYYYDANGYLRRVPESLMYRGWAQQTSQAWTGYGTRQSVQKSVPQVMYYQLPPAKVSSPNKTSVKAKSRSSTQSRLSKPQLKSQSTWVLPPVPRSGYSARWDTRPVQGSPDGLFWVVNPANRISGLPPDKFEPFWAKCVQEGTPIKVYDRYDPGNRFPNPYTGR